MWYETRLKRQAEAYKPQVEFYHFPKSNGKPAMGLKKESGEVRFQFWDHSGYMGSLNGRVGGRVDVGALLWELGPAIHRADRKHPCLAGRWPLGWIWPRTWPQDSLGTDHLILPMLGFQELPGIPFRMQFVQFSLFKYKAKMSFSRLSCWAGYKHSWDWIPPGPAINVLPRAGTGHFQAQV